MTRHGSRQDSAVLTAVRHIQDFGFLGWHLRRREGEILSADTMVDGKVLHERQVVQVSQYAVENFSEHDENAVFLMMGAPKPVAGDGLVALTRYWLVDDVETLYSGSHDPIYSVLCVPH